MNRTLAALATAGALVLAAPALAAVPGPGATVHGTISPTLDSGSAEVGTAFTLSNLTDGANNAVGGHVDGHVSSVTRAGQGRPGKIELAFDRYIDGSGHTHAFAAQVQDVHENTKTNVGKEVLGGVAGMVLGNYIGKHLGVNIGGAVGAAGGYVLAKNNRQNVTIPGNSIVTVRVLTPRHVPSGR